jgi:V/A-type H+/Na+-transporting ATPase subunit A
MNDVRGHIRAVRGSMITVTFYGRIHQNEIAYVLYGREKLKSEVLRIDQNQAVLQVFEETNGLRVGDEVQFTGKLLSVNLGPGLLGQVYDGLQNPLEKLADKAGNFLIRGLSYDALDKNHLWDFRPLVNAGKKVKAGSFLGEVGEGAISHKIMVPFNFRGYLEVHSIREAGTYTIHETIAELMEKEGYIHKVSMSFTWPVRVPVTCYEERRLPEKPLLTGTRIIDTFFPVARGGTYCIPGPFGAGKTVLQQITSRYAKVDIVIIVACGERSGEVVETMREFPKLSDPSSGRTLMERTIIISNTSSMPVAARDSSVYTGITLAEYYRQMGLDVLLLADSTSRWAQAMREMSGLLEEIPGEEAFPAYLESRIARFYERAGLIRLQDGSTGSITIGGTVSPAGGNFDEPVTQSSLKVVGAFHGLSRERAGARRFPSIHPLESWSKYRSVLPEELVKRARKLLKKGNEVLQMMSVLGEEGISIKDYMDYLRSELIDAVYLQQNSFDETDAFCPRQRQEHVFPFLIEMLDRIPVFSEKKEARSFFIRLQQLFIDWNYSPWGSEAFIHREQSIRKMVDEVAGKSYE